MAGDLHKLATKLLAHTHTNSNYNNNKSDNCDEKRRLRRFGGAQFAQVCVCMCVLLFAAFRDKSLFRRRSQTVCLHCNGRFNRNRIAHSSFIPNDNRQTRNVNVNSNDSCRCQLAPAAWRQVRATAPGRFRRRSLARSIARSRYTRTQKLAARLTSRRIATIMSGGRATNERRGITCELRAISDA